MRRLACPLVALAVALGACRRAPSIDASAYETRAAHDPDGIGRIWMGREIARPVGLGASEWLERPERVVEEPPEPLLAALDLRPDDLVADVGAGTGWLTFRLAPLVPRGKVYAVDVDGELVKSIRVRAAQLHAANVEAIVGEESDPRLPDGVRLAVLVDAYHELAWPRETMLAIGRSLAPHGRVALVEYRAEEPAPPIKPLHRMTEAQACAELAAVGFRWVRTTELRTQHLMVFEKLPP